MQCLRRFYLQLSMIQHEFIMLINVKMLMYIGQAMRSWYLSHMFCCILGSYQKGAYQKQGKVTEWCSIL